MECKRLAIPNSRSQADVKQEYIDLVQAFLIILSEQNFLNQIYLLQEGNRMF